MDPEEEYIWSMRFYKAMEESTDERRTSESEQEMASPAARIASRSSSLLYTHPEKIEKQVRIFASFLPDEALVDVDDYVPRQIECCLLYGRISGMHCLIDRYHKMKADFKLKLTNQLNQFVGAMVQEILSNGGDVLKFSPTALVAIWKCSRGAYMTQNVHIAIDCALVIQKQYGKFILETGEKLKVDFAMTAGSVYFSLIGNESFSKYLVFGPVYEDVRKARKAIAVKNIIVSPSAMQFIHSFEYRLEQIEGGTFFQVIGLTKMWKQVRKNEYQDTSAHRLELTNTSFITINTLNTGGSLRGSFDEFCLRPILQGLVENADSFTKRIAKFFPEGIRDGISADEPIENLVELRDVAVVTISVSTAISKCTRMLKATDGIFRTVHRYSAKYKGYINYVSILENNIMLSITFGMKSTSHVMQHRSALKCAYEIMSVLKDASKINGVTIGVSTGRAYYTVFGHTLRQDLTLFGRTVTDATALSLTFNDRIVCDQDTFIHSRMKASCFSLMKEQYHSTEELPAGAIYELVTDDFDLSEELPFYDQPTIGRDREVSIYEGLIAKFLKNLKSRESVVDTPNAMYIKGYPKEGKTRLLHEIVRVTERNIPVHFIPLHCGDDDVAYFFIRKLFSAEFDCDLLSSLREERKKELQQRLDDMPRSDLIWAINPVFHVNFPETEEFWNYSTGEKFLTMLKILKHLCYKIFTIPWLVVVDDADYLDEESWKVLEVLLDTNTFFLVLTRNRDYALCPNKGYNFSNNPSVVKLKIGVMSPNFLSGIACQHLRVFAIPADLEYLLQKKSNGNIGYIKNLLTNLRHRGYFTLREVNYPEIVEEKLITPSMNLIIPMTNTEKHNLLMFIVKKGKYDKNEFKRILWYLFVESFQNEKFYQLREKIYEIVLKSKKIRVCLLTKNLIMNDIPDDLTENIHITQIFELLTYPEQMILKCCSVLGDTFPRMVLEHVLTLDYYTLLAPAVRSFFEMGILCCAHGDFTDGVQFVVSREKCVDPRFTDDMSCTCRGLFNQERFRTLPDYAYCGLLRFRYARFREIIYEQLRESQKVEFHSKVVIFLHEETKRCRSCGRDAFEWDTHKRLDDFQQEERKRDRYSKKFMKKHEHDMDQMQTTMHELFYEDMNFIPKYSGTVKTGSHISMDGSYSREHELPLVDSEVFTVKKIFGPTSISKLKMNLSLVRTFSSSDFTYCDCEEILSTYYREMIIHCHGAGQLMKQLENMQRYAYICIANRNISEAQNILKQAYDCINDIFETEKPPPIWKKKLFEAKLSTISALAYKELGLYTESFGQLTIALEKFGVKFPKSNIGKLLSLAKAKLQKLLTFYAFPEMHTKKLNFCVCDYYVDVSEALDLYAKFLMGAGKWQAAELVASWALYKALNAQTSFVRICDCFCNMILLAVHNKDRCMNVALEVHALRYCFRKTSRVESWELAAVCRLYMTIVIGKFCRSELEYSIHLGYVIIRMAASLNDTEKLLLISSYLVTVLLAKLYLQEAVSLLLELEFCSDNIDDLAGQVWFHSQALLFHMEIGYCIVPYEQCLSFLEIQAIKSIDVYNNDSIKRLTILMWLWCLRNEQWERAARFEEHIELYVASKIPSVRTVLSLLYVLEGFLLIYVHKLNSSNIAVARKLHKTIKRLIKILERESKFLEVLVPKLIALKAYYFYIRNNEKKAFKLLKKSLQSAKKYGLVMMEEWIKHTTKAWKNELPKKKMDFWRDHCEENNLVFYQEFDMNTDDIGFFTLPTPLYV